MKFSKSNAWMALGIVLMSVKLSGCQDHAQKTKFDAAGCAIPIDYEYRAIDAKTPYQAWQVRVANGKITWNGVEITEKELKKYADQLSMMPIDAGSITFEVKDVSCENRTLVRQSLSNSLLCKKGRCWESEESVKAPIVY